SPGGGDHSDHACRIASTATPLGSGTQFSTPLLWRIFRLFLGGAILGVCILYLATRRLKGDQTIGATFRMELHKAWVARRTFAFDRLRRPVDRLRQSVRLLFCHMVLVALYSVITYVERLPQGKDAERWYV